MDPGIVVGDYVLLQRQWVSRNLSTNLSPRWTGPYRVVETVGPNNVLLDKDGRHKLFHVNLMKKTLNAKD